MVAEICCRAVLFLSSRQLSFLGVGCSICTKGIDGGGGWGEAQHGNHLKVGWLLWRPTAAQWQQREPIELQEEVGAVESAEDYRRTHTHAKHRSKQADGSANPCTWRLVYIWAFKHNTTQHNSKTCTACQGFHLRYIQIKLAFSNIQPLDGNQHIQGECEWGRRQELVTVNI